MRITALNTSSGPDPSQPTQAQPKGANTSAAPAGRPACQNSPQPTGQNPPARRFGSSQSTAASQGNATKISATKTYDKRDTNQDGAVPYQEELLYSLQHTPM